MGASAVQDPRLELQQEWIRDLKEAKMSWCGKIRLYEAFWLLSLSFSCQYVSQYVYKLGCRVSSIFDIFA